MMDFLCLSVCVCVSLSLSLSLSASSETVPLSICKMNAQIPSDSLILSCSTAQSHKGLCCPLVSSVVSIDSISRP